MIRKEVLEERSMINELIHRSICKTNKTRLTSNIWEWQCFCSARQRQQFIDCWTVFDQKFDFRVLKSTLVPSRKLFVPTLNLRGTELTMYKKIVTDFPKTVSQIGLPRATQIILKNVLNIISSLTETTLNNSYLKKIITTLFIRVPYYTTPIHSVDIRKKFFKNVDLASK